MTCVCNFTINSSVLSLWTGYLGTSLRFAKFLVPFLEAKRPGRILGKHCVFVICFVICLRLCSKAKSASWTWVLVLLLIICVVLCKSAENKPFNCRLDCLTLVNKTKQKQKLPLSQQESPYEFQGSFYKNIMSGMKEVVVLFHLGCFACTSRVLCSKGRF